jgi:hypothetical protein
MNDSVQWKAYFVAGLFSLLTELAWATLSPLYETGMSVVLTPALCLLGAAFMVCHVLKKPWAYRYSPYYAVGTGAVMAAFVGDSDEFYGKYAAAMRVLEICVLASSLALLAVYFLPAVKSRFASVQPNTALERSRER